MTRHELQAHLDPLNKEMERQTVQLCSLEAGVDTIAKGQGDIAKKLETAVLVQSNKEDWQKLYFRLFGIALGLLVLSQHPALFKLMMDVKKVVW